MGSVYLSRKQIGLTETVHAKGLAWVKCSINVFIIRWRVKGKAVSSFHARRPPNKQGAHAIADGWMTV